MTVARGLGRAAAGTLAALALLLMGSTATAVGAPVLALENPAGGTLTNDATPPFEGTSSDILDPVTVSLYEGSSAGGSPLQTSAEVLPTLLGQWAITLAEPLQSGQYTAVAAQHETATEEDATSEVTFVVDTISPSVSISSISSPANDATPTLSGDAGSASGDAGSVTLTVYEGSSVGGPVAEALTVPRSGSSWSQGIGALPDGTYTAQAVQEDSAGNVGKSGAMTFTIDTQKPIVSLDPVTSPTSDSTPTITGSAGALAGDHPSVVVAIRHEGSVVRGSPSVAVSGGKWSYTPSSLPDGAYTVEVLQEDTAGNEGSAGPLAFTIDTHTPTVSIESLPSAIKDPTPTLSGAAGTLSGDGEEVQVLVHKGSISGEVVESTSVVRSGSSWSHTTGALPDGTYTAQAVQKDEAGTKGESSAMTFTVDTHAPVVTINGVVTPTKDSTPTFTGGAGALSGDHSSVTVVIRKESAVVSESQSVGVSGGKWSYTPSSLPDGIYSVQVSQSDVAGNLGTAGPVAFTIDMHTPSVSIEAVSSPTNNSTPTLTGAAGAQPGDDESVLVVVHKGSIGGEVVETVSVARSGSSWSHTTAALADGTYVAQALQEDEAGARGESSAMTFVVDTDAPTVSIDSVATPTKDATPTFTGSAGALTGDHPDHPSVAVVIKQGGSVVNEAKSVSVSGGKWSYTVSAQASLADGAYTVQVSQEDAANNLGSAGPVAFVIDSHPPRVSINSLVSPTNDSTPTLSGAAGTRALDDKTVRVAIYKGTSAVGVPVEESAEVPVSEASWSYIPPLLADGTYTAQVEQQDAANERGTSAVVFVVDTTAPVVSIDSVATPTKDATPTFTGSAGALTGDHPDHPSVAVVIKQGGSVVNEAKSVSVSGGKWSYTVSAQASLADGAYTVQVSQEDAANNLGSAGPVAFVVDTNAPNPTIDPLASTTNDSTPTFTGTAGTRPLDDGTARVAIYKGTTVVGTPVAESAEVPVSAGAWSYTAPTLADGTYTAQVEQQDKANERGTSSIIFAIDTTAPHVTLAQPSNEAILVTAQPTFSGLAGIEAGDQASVSLSIYAGTVPSGSPLQALKIAVNHGEWSSGTSTSSLPNGFYTAVVDQVDEAGNDGRSVSTFAISVPPPVTATPTAPVASFSWFPTTPHVGEPVSLVSTSTAGSSPITGFAWNASGGTALTAGPSVLATTFSTPGPHLVRLQVTDANGLSGVTGETITVARAAAVLMQPFPVVRIAGSGSGRSIRISLFTVLAPTGAKVTVNCHGRGCPSAPQSIIARAGRNHRRAATVLISFTRFERSLRAGAVLEIRVTRPGQIGKYTRFTIRRGKLPARLDTCLSPGGITPMSCPS